MTRTRQGSHGYSRLPKPTKANRIVRQKAKQYPNLRIVDFAGAVKAVQAEGKKVGWRHGVHLKREGYRIRNQANFAALQE